MLVAAKQETWLLVVDGGARTGSFDVAKGDAIFAQADGADIHAGAAGMVGLVAYRGVGSIRIFCSPADQRQCRRTQAWRLFNLTRFPILRP
jgi:hypothetical protein